jgi:hypothetical protein
MRFAANRWHRDRGFLSAPLSVVLGAAGCGTATEPPASTTAAAPSASPSAGVLTAADVKSIVETATASVNLPLIIAVTDCSGNVLAIYRKANAPARAAANLAATSASDEVAVALARSATVFCNDQTLVSTRTMRYLPGSHFPPGTSFAGSGPLYGIENTNRGCGFNVSYLRGQGLPVPTSLAGDPGWGILTGKPNGLNSAE